MSCLVCTDELGDTDIVRIPCKASNCDVIVHSKCSVDFFLKNRTRSCMICRKSLMDNENESASENESDGSSDSDSSDSEDLTAPSDSDSDSESNSDSDSEFERKSLRDALREAELDATDATKQAFEEIHKMKDEYNQTKQLESQYDEELKPLEMEMERDVENYSRIQHRRYRVTNRSTIAEIERLRKKRLMLRNRIFRARKVVAVRYGYME